MSPLHQEQSYVLGHCEKCGASRIVCDDWDHVEWGDDGEDPECSHEYCPEIQYPEERLFAEQMKRYQLLKILKTARSKKLRGIKNVFGHCR